MSGSSYLEQRVDRLERILVARGIATEWDFSHHPDAVIEGDTGNGIS